MQIIGVIDLRGGRAVHARGGIRAEYRPVTSVAGRAIPDGDPVALARRYIELGVRQLYVADLDAITGGTPQHATVASVLACGVPLWLDAGVSSPNQARDAAALPLATLIVGLETLPSFATLADICSAVDAHVAFSLDLRDGVPLGAATAGTGTPEDLAAAAVAAGAQAVIVLDLARVGCGAGLDLLLVERIREAVPEVTLAAGGGIRDHSDLASLAAIGVDAALVGTAVLSGRLDPRTSF